MLGARTLGEYTHNRRDWIGSFRLNYPERQTVTLFATGKPKLPAS